ncbi:MAG: HAMP domain-containing histidine kinase [Flavobacteriaceae bacterium]|nr:HAMP domain-containing histidine kinase [Flavobacteriaceae bacterium]
MNQKKYLWILYIIIVTIVLTIATQVFWNYKNYQINKQQFKNDIQISLDNAVEGYFTDLAKTGFLTLVEYNSDTLQHTLEIDSPFIERKFDSLFVKDMLEDIEQQHKNDSINYTIKGFSKIFKPDGKRAITFMKSDGGIKRMSVFRGKKASDSLKSLNNLKLINDITTIYISLTRDSLNFSKLNSFLEKELGRKSLAIPYTLKHYKNDSIIYVINNQSIRNDYFKIFTNSTYLKKNEKLELLFSNETKIILKRSFLGILLSLVLSLVIILSLFYLLHIIKKQKELAEIKNDLISNITHEFKTPITTASTAIEALSNFNVLDNIAKTKDYLSISSNQLKKLHLMVEKLLETATLDSENLLLKKEAINVVDLVDKCVKRQQLTNHKKEITFSTNNDELIVTIDAFHFENAINNLIDNAIKYGGNNIEINVNSVLNTLEISIADNGLNIDKNQRGKIFDKFYRIPKGNTHDVKGFGIGLYYAKKIIEKHNGTIVLVPNTKNTIFKIAMPL